MANPIDLDELLHGKPTWEQVVEFWRATQDGAEEFYEERYLAEAIKKHLRTEDQRKRLYDLDLSIEEVLNGRYTSKQSGAVRAILKEWNAKLGFEAFRG